MIRSAGEFDVIVVDGPARGRTRLKCCRAALAALREGGLIILDNSDWLPESSNLLRTSGLLEVDFTGFAPICGHVQTTSLYFQRAFNVPPANGRQPMPGRGARRDNWERPLVPGPGALITCDGESFRGVIDDLAVRARNARGREPEISRARTIIGGDDRRCIAILDVDRDRVLLMRPSSRPADGQCQSQPVERNETDCRDDLAEEYRAFICAHEYRQYVL